MIIPMNITGLNADPCATPQHGVQHGAIIVFSMHNHTTHRSNADKFFHENKLGNSYALSIIVWQDVSMKCIGWRLCGIIKRSREVLPQWFCLDMIPGHLFYWFCVVYGSSGTWHQPFLIFFAVIPATHQPTPGLMEPCDLISTLLGPGRPDDLLKRLEVRSPPLSPRR